jgi:hypothetical protein
MTSLHHNITMRTTLALDEDIYRAAKALADGSGRSLGAVVSELARRGLRPARRPAKPGFPTVDVPADAEVIPGNRADELLAEEGP